MADFEISGQTIYDRNGDPVGYTEKLSAFADQLKPIVSRKRYIFNVIKDVLKNDPKKNL